MQNNKKINNNLKTKQNRQDKQKKTINTQTQDEHVKANIRRTCASTTLKRTHEHTTANHTRTTRKQT